MIYYLNNYYGTNINRTPLDSYAMNNKIEYFLGLLKKSKIEYRNISFGFTSDKGLTRKYIDTKENIIYMSALNFSIQKGYNIISLLYLYIVLFIFIILNVKKEDTVILYHNPWIYYLVKSTKFIKKYNLILEIEELCQFDSSNSSKKNNIYKYFEDKIIKISNRFIVVNDKVKEYLISKYCININKIEICYGNFNKLDLYNKFNNGNYIKDTTVNILYSGSIDKVRGAFLILDMLPHLKSSNYNLYITGYGSEKDVSEFKNKLSKIGNDKVKFLGSLSEVEYDKLLYNSNICLNCQYNNGEFSKYSFPSKIINYLCFNNYVLSTKMISVIDSKVGNFIEYYDSNDIVDFANKLDELIIRCLTSRDITKNISNLRNEIESNIVKLINLC